MPTEKNAAFLPTQYSFKLDRQRVNTVLKWPDDGCLQPKHVAKYNLIVIIASCLDVCCVLTVHNILYKSDNTQQDGLSKKKKYWKVYHTTELQKYSQSDIKNRILF